jgi:hypothetical protein
LKTAGERAIAFDRTGEVSKGHSTGDDLSAFVQQHWTRIGAQLLAGTYRLQPVRQVEMPKPKGGVRKLRCYYLKQWGRSGYRQLRKRGVSVRQALPKQYFALLGLPDLVER